MVQESQIFEPCHRNKIKIKKNLKKRIYKSVPTYPIQALIIIVLLQQWSSESDGKLYAPVLAIKQHSYSPTTSNNSTVWASFNDQTP